MLLTETERREEKRYRDRKFRDRNELIILSLDKYSSSVCSGTSLKKGIKKGNSNWWEKGHTFDGWPFQAFLYKKHQQQVTMIVTHTPEVSFSLSSLRSWNILDSCRHFESFDLQLQAPGFDGLGEGPGTVGPG